MVFNVCIGIIFGHLLLVIKVVKMLLNVLNWDIYF